MRLFQRYQNVNGNTHEYDDEYSITVEVTILSILKSSVDGV
jgi:hypothetical protein